MSGGVRGRRRKPPPTRSDNNMSDFSINEMQEMQKAGKMRTEKQKTGIVCDSHRRTKVKNLKLRVKILSL